jgi:hypothetical protein
MGGAALVTLSRSSAVEAQWLIPVAPAAGIFTAKGVGSGVPAAEALGVRVNSGAAVDAGVGARVPGRSRRRGKKRILKGKKPSVSFP